MYSKVMAHTKRFICIDVVAEFPPIPVRDCDWSAVVDGYEESGPYGRGATRQAAVDDLLEQLDERSA